ncbi:hypothetical protein Gp_69 [Bacillus phage vB_Bacillus_1020A]|nr:hypothetical protein Gp_69 [Bacillus phage vB_Bacillus_1020A]
MGLETATLRCPKCHKGFQVLADEQFDHGCPHCGYGQESEAKTMNLDVYVCPKDHGFAVKDGEEPVLCPFCGTKEIEYSHSVNE